ncbi:diguanylate cyclase [Vibrio sp. S4M6]|uniref:sensor domain-containing diguanylate cyclase n=1 Tax=Vibrio sinus TaxID=2946865 RepID=UPI00202A39F8|nr:diguanylate cyclase [Vibrio sinus]MCL9782019.1 diguanylate cyclase [Vibrio sinus]
MTLKHRIIYLPLVVVFIISALNLFIVDRQLDKELNSRVKTELGWLAKSAMVTLSEITAPLTIKNIDPVAKRLSSASDARITFIDAAGVVTGDSQVPYDSIAQVDNHAYRPEILEAKQSGVGFATRYSDTIEKEFTYVAVYQQFMHGNESVGYFARASLPEDTVKHELMQLRQALIVVLAMSTLALVVLSFFSSRWIAMSVEEDRTKLREKIDSGVRDIELLYELDSILGSCSEISEASNVVKQIVPQLLPNATGAVSVYKSSRNRLETKIFWGRKWQEKTSFLPDQCWALRKGHAHRSNHNGTQLYCDHFSTIQSESAEASTVCVPLVALGEAIGVMHCVSKNFNENELLLVESIAKRIGLALANINLRYHLKQQAISDVLTGLYNRRYLYESLEQLVARAKRNQTKIGILMGDIDHFKNFNDEYGHDAGDTVLQAVSEVMLEMTRGGDIVCRYGGEEFCIALPDSDLERSVLVAEKIRKSIESVDVNIGLKNPVSVSMSIGVSVYSSDNQSITEVISIADRQLYIAKSDGRNCVR